MGAVIDVWWAVTAALFGSALGSYLGVVIDRLPAGRGLREASVCGRCGSTIRRVDNVPVFSYLLLRGRCRSCGVRIAPAWWLLEVGLAAVWAACAAALELAWPLVPVLVFVGLFVAALGLVLSVRRRSAIGHVSQRWRWGWLGAGVPVLASALFAVLAGSMLQGGWLRLTVIGAAGGLTLAAAPAVAPPSRPVTGWR